MNHAKIAAALHALADAFLEGAETVEQALKPAKGKKGAATEAAASPQANQLAAPATSAPVANFTPSAYTPPAAAVAEVVAPVPSIDKPKLNAAVLKVAAKSRDAAEAILARFGAKNTVTLPPEQWQAVYDAFEEEIARIDAAAVQVAQASLV